MGVRPIYLTEGDPSGISHEMLSQEGDTLVSISKSRPIFLFRSRTQLQYPYPNYVFSDSLFPESGIFQVYADTFLGKKKPIVKKIQLGKPSQHTGAMSYDSLLAGMKAISNIFGDLITLPLSKEYVMKSGVQKFSGHTEALSDYFKMPTFMMMTGDKWNVIPLTTHIPIQKVANALKKIMWKELLVSIMKSGLFSKHPSLAFMGLNPHAGEGGRIGNEEIEILEPAMKLARKMGFRTIGPLPADSTFHLTNKPNWDITLACYHDQGLIPFKLLEGKKGINLTLGLPFLRVSPDHGPAYSIAGKGIADSTSLQQCLKWVVK
jgi:4-hydroxythreonine-4-phosphate dehydrogenase